MRGVARYSLLMLSPGYSLRAPDNDSFYYELGEDVPACPRCGLVTQLYWLNPPFKLKRTKYDVSYTYDSALIVSERFVAFATRYPGARFLRLRPHPGFSKMVIDPIAPSSQGLEPPRNPGRFTECSGPRLEMP